MWRERSREPGRGSEEGCEDKSMRRLAGKGSRGRLWLMEQDVSRFWTDDANITYRMNRRENEIKKAARVTAMNFCQVSESS